MTGESGEQAARDDRIAEASDWFARMRGPDAENAREAFAAWKAHPENARAYAEIAAIWRVAAGSDYRAALAPPAPGRPRWAVPGLVAAGLGAALALGFVVTGKSGFGGRASDVEFASAPGALRDVALADGSRVTLDSGSRVSVTLGEVERRVTLLAGRARFTVAHDKQRPFVVLAGSRAVIARGTVFDVRRQGGGVEVTLLEGAVDLEERDGAKPPRRLGTLRPGQAAVFAVGKAAPRIVAAAAEAWPMGILAGDGMRLGDLVAQVNRSGGTKIVLASADIADLRISGGVRTADAAALAASLAAALDLSLERDGEVIVLSRTAQTPPSHAP